MNNKIFISVRHINVYKIPNEDFLYYVKDKEKPFDITKLKNWGFDIGTKMSKDPINHWNVIKEAIYHSWLDDYLIDNGIETISR